MGCVIIHVRDTACARFQESKVQDDLLRVFVVSHEQIVTLIRESDEKYRRHTSVRLRGLYQTIERGEKRLDPSESGSSSPLRFRYTTGVELCPTQVKFTHLSRQKTFAGKSWKMTCF